MANMKGYGDYSKKKKVKRLSERELNGNEIGMFSNMDRNAEKA